MRGKLWVLTLVVVGILAFAACGGQEETTKIKLAMDWYPNANHAGIFVARWTLPR